MFARRFGVLLKRAGLSSKTRAVGSGVHQLGQTDGRWGPQGARIAAGMAMTLGASVALSASSFALAESAVAVEKAVELEELKEYSPMSENGRELSSLLRKTVHSKDDLEIVLYQYQPCPFCNKVRAFLDLNQIPYKTVEVDPLRKTELKWSNYKKVPVVVVNGTQLNDSTEIIATLSTVLDEKRQKTDFTADEKKWLFWLDDYFVHLLPSNIYRTTRESIQTFDYLTTEGNFSWYVRESARYSGAAIMYLIAKRLKKKYNIGDAREDLYAALNQWIEAVDEKGGQFLGGSSPDLADVAVFGVVRSLINFDTFDDIMSNSNVKPWYERMVEVVGPSAKIAS